MEESFRSTIEMKVKKKDIKQIRIIIKQLMTMGVIDEEVGKTILLGTHCFR